MLFSSVGIGRSGSEDDVAHGLELGVVNHVASSIDQRDFRPGCVAIQTCGMEIRADVIFGTEDDINSWDEATDDSEEEDKE